MTEARIPKTMRTIPLLIAVLLISMPAQAKYSGGTGGQNDPYKIANPDDLIMLGDSPEDYNKHFILTADIDLDPNLPGGKFFDTAVITPENNYDDPEAFGGTSFSGCFDGQGHVISNLNIQGNRYLGLFGYLDFQGVVTNLGLEAVNVNGTGNCVGALLGYNNGGDISTCYSTGIINGDEDVGGLIGYVYYGTVLNSYSTAQVIGDTNVGGLVGLNVGSVAMSYSVGSVTGNQNVGGLVGHDWITSRGGGSSGSTVKSFWDIQTSGQATSTGGTGKTTAEMQTAATFLGWGTCGNEGTWMIDDNKDYPRLWWQNRLGEPIAVGETLSDILTGAGTEDSPYLIYTADELHLVGHFPCDWDKRFRLMADIDLSGFLYDTALIAPNIGKSEWSFQGTAFTGVFDGNGHTISHLTIVGRDFLGLFGQLDSAAEVKDLGIVDVNITGTGDDVGGLVGSNEGNIFTCYCTGEVSGNDHVGGLAGFNSGEGSVTIANCSFTGTVTGNEDVGGLVGLNFEFVTGSSSTGKVSGNELVGGLVGGSEGRISSCYSASEVNGNYYVGGFIGRNPWNDWGTITDCYSTGAVSGYNYVGGFTGCSYVGRITNSYSTGSVSGDEHVGGFAGYGVGDYITLSFWDVETSGQITSVGGTGRTTAQMQDPNTFIAEGWDFIGQLDGSQDIWAEPEDGGYPILSWQLQFELGLPDFSGGNGEPDSPYLITTKEELNSIGHNPRLMESHFKLINDLDLTDFHFYPIGSPDYPYRSVFDGNGHTISHLTIEGEEYLGLFSVIGDGAEVKDLRVVDVNITGSGEYIGSLAGLSSGDISNCCITGTVIGGDYYIGGLMGYNNGNITTCHSSSTVSGNSYIGGLVGYNDNGIIIKSYSTGTTTGGEYHAGGLAGVNDGNIIISYSTSEVRGNNDVGGLVGYNNYHWTDCATITNCYSTGMVTGKRHVGGLVGDSGLNWKDGTITNCYSTGLVSGDDVGGFVGDSSSIIISCFWDVETSGQTVSGDGEGKTTTQMQTESTFTDAGWDFVDETDNGTEDIWWIEEGRDYPRLWWEHNDEP